MSKFKLYAHQTWGERWLCGTYDDHERAYQNILPNMLEAAIFHDNSRRFSIAPAKDGGRECDEFAVVYDGDEGPFIVSTLDW